MGRGRRARQRRNRKRRRARLAPPSWRLEVSLAELEVARAHDGALRGDIEPRLVVGAYHARGGRAVLIGRALSAVDAPGSAPFRVEVERELVRATVFGSGAEGPAGTFVVLVLALEEDSGRDVQALYAELEHPARWAVWDAAGPMPEPRALEELGLLPPSVPPVAERVQLLFGETQRPPSPESDELVGALLVRVPEDPGARGCDWRFHFQAPDGKNDWTAILRIRVTGA